MMTDEELEVLLALIYERIGAWHDADTNVDLHEWLGWTWEEYRAFAEGRVT